MRARCNPAADRRQHGDEGGAGAAYVAAGSPGRDPTFLEPRYRYRSFDGGTGAAGDWRVRPRPAPCADRDTPPE